MVEKHWPAQPFLCRGMTEAQKSQVTGSGGVGPDAPLPDAQST